MLLTPDPGLGDPRQDETITAEIRRIQAQAHGRRAADARTIWHDDIVVCVLQDVFTATEARRVEEGEFERVREERIARRAAIEPLYAACVETVTGRPVRGHLSEISSRGVAFEAFILG